MDSLFAQLPKRQYLLSSSDIPDDTRDIDVGADDMLINALNQMNRSSGRYLFLDQARISGFGQLELVTTRKKGETKPDLYIRGSISQLDSDTVDNAISLGHDSATGRGIANSLYRNNRTLSIVSVDLHLVQYPSRRVLAGGSVSNSMVVARRGINGAVAGMIDSADIAVPISIDRIESQGQAVRNLIELGLIELLGKHAGVPYWQCLGGETTDAKAAEKRERKHVLLGADIVEIQERLLSLGYLSDSPNGTLDADTRAAITRFQAANNLIPSGQPDFDFVERLREVSRPTNIATPTPPKPVAPPVKTPSTPRQTPSTPGASPTCVGQQNCEGIYKNLYDFIKDDVEF